MTDPTPDANQNPPPVRWPRKEEDLPPGAGPRYRISDKWNP